MASPLFRTTFPIARFLLLHLAAMSVFVSDLRTFVAGQGRAA